MKRMLTLCENRANFAVSGRKSKVDMERIGVRPHNKQGSAHDEEIIFDPL